MITAALFEDVSWDKGTTRQTLKKFINENYKVDEDQVDKNITRALAKMQKDKEVAAVTGTKRVRMTIRWRDEYMKATGRKMPEKKEKKKPRAKKEGPKRARSAWNFYSKEKRTELRKKYPNDDFGDISKRLSQKWKALDDTAKTKWTKLATEDKKRYNKELKEEEKKKKKKKSESESASESESDDKKKKKKKKKSSESESEESKSKGKEKEKGKK